MSLERDHAEFAEVVNETLDSIINDMAEMRAEKNELLEDIFEKLGRIEHGIGGLAEGQRSLSDRMSALEKRVSLNQDGFQNDLKDVRRRVRTLENHGIDPDEEITPRPAPPR